MVDRRECSRDHGDLEALRRKEIYHADLRCFQQLPRNSNEDVHGQRGQRQL